MYTLVITTTIPAAVAAEFLRRRGITIDLDAGDAWAAARSWHDALDPAEGRAAEFTVAADGLHLFYTSGSHETRMEVQYAAPVRNPADLAAVVSAPRGALLSTALPADPAHIARLREELLTATDAVLAVRAADPYSAADWSEAEALRQLRALLQEPAVAAVQP